MFRQLLNIVIERETVIASELACELGISQALIKQMLGELERQGCLQSLTQGDSSACDRCPLHKACLFSNQPRIFTLTTKGDRISANIKSLTGSI